LAIALAITGFGIDGFRIQTARAQSVNGPLAGAASGQNAGAQNVGSIQRLDPALDQLIAPHTPVEKLAAGLRFAEGPVWVPAGALLARHDDGYLLFSDIPGNAIMKWSPEGKVSIFRRPVFAGSFPDGAQAGTNGLTLDLSGRLIAAEHGNRRVSRTEKDGSITVLASRFEGKRLNSPNDLVVKQNGDIYFTDPPYGLRSMLGGSDPTVDPKGLAEARELDFSGVYRISHGKLVLLIRDIPNPNGLAFSPDEKKLYICNSDPNRKIWWVYDVKRDGTLGSGRIFADLTKDGMGVPDRMKVDRKGNIFSSGPGGIVILSPEAKHLGTLQFPEQPANLAWGDADGKTLYVTARTGLYRVRTNTEGIITTGFRASRP
jgi:gluconolactonase